MRIALVCPYAWDDPGGVQVHVRELGGRLRARGHEVIALAPARRRPNEPWVVRVGTALNVPYNASNAPISPWPATRRAVRKALEAFGPEVVHAHEPLTPSASMFATLVSRVPVVATFHSGAARSRLFDIAAPALRRVATRITTWVAVSEAAAAFARARVGGTFVIVPNGVDVARFASATPADLGAGRKVLFVGRLDERKGFPTMVRAFERLAGDRGDVLLIVIGDGSDKASVGDLPSELRDRVRLLGAVPNAEIHPILAGCDVYAGPSVGGESFGVVLVEAMAAGLPVVASDIPGYREVIRHDRDGLLVPPRDPGALASALAAVLDDPDLGGRLAAAGQERAAAFDWDVVAGRLEELYRDAVAAGRPPLR